MGLDKRLLGAARLLNCGCFAIRMDYSTGILELGYLERLPVIENSLIRHSWLIKLLFFRGKRIPPPHQNNEMDFLFTELYPFRSDRSPMILPGGDSIYLRNQWTVLDAKCFSPAWRRYRFTVAHIQEKETHPCLEAERRLCWAPRLGLITQMGFNTRA